MKLFKFIIDFDSCQINFCVFILFALISARIVGLMDELNIIGILYFTLQPFIECAHFVFRFDVNYRSIF